MLLTTKHFLTVSKKCQQVSPFCERKSSKPGFRDLPKFSGEDNPYQRLIDENPDDYVLDPLEFRNDPEIRGEGKPIKKPAKTFFGQFLYKRPKLDLSFKGLGNMAYNYVLANKKKDQLYNIDRVEMLGNDLSAAHFIVCRGGGVKFVGQENFIQNGINKSHLVLPGYKDERYKVEAINAAGIPLFYEGLQNMRGLTYLTWLSVKDNPYFDNWCMDRLSLITPNLEYLNLSGCKRINHLSFACLYRFKQLKYLDVSNTNDTKAFKLACLTIESEYPDLCINGIVFKKQPKSVFN